MDQVIAKIFKSKPIIINDRETQMDYSNRYVLLY
jgi:hypothetical protein